MAAPNSRRACLSLTYSELAFIQKLLKAEYHFITDQEQKTRQSFGRKFSDITLPGGRKDGVELYLSHLEVSFLQKLTKGSYSFLTLAEREARQKLRSKIRTAWEEVVRMDDPAERKA